MPEKSERRGGEDEAAGFGVPVVMHMIKLRLRMPLKKPFISK